MTAVRDIEALYATQHGFAPVDPSDEELHADSGEHDYTLSETSYLGFNVPEAGIACQIYHWFHPRLGVVSGGVMIYRGIKQRAGEAEYLDYRNVMPAPPQIADVRYDTGVRVRVVEPLRRIDVSLDARDASFDVRLEAIKPPAGRADGKHFAQAMRATGSLVLRGERHTVDSYFTRDRSYGSPRPELSHPIPPQTWGAAVFGEDLALHFVGSDGDTCSADNVRWGYVLRGGELRAITAMRKRTMRGADGVTPVSIEVELADSAGDSYRLGGQTIALLPMSFWPNMVTHLALQRYELEGRIGHGDYQDIVFPETLRRAAGERP